MIFSKEKRVHWRTFQQKSRLCNSLYELTPRRNTDLTCLLMINQRKHGKSRTITEVIIFNNKNTSIHEQFVKL